MCNRRQYGLPKGGLSRMVIMHCIGGRGSRKNVEDAGKQKRQELGRGERSKGQVR